MPKFCSECGEKLLDENMKFCSECGEPLISPSIQPQEKKLKESPDATQNIEKIPVSDTSRLSNLKIEKFLVKNEVTVYATRGSLYVGGEQGLKGYVTNKRVIFYTGKGLIFKSDRLHEIPLKDLNYFKIIEEGLVFKVMYLQLNNLRIKGERSVIIGLYKAIQVEKQGIK